MSVRALTGTLKYWWKMEKITHWTMDLILSWPTSSSIRECCTFYASCLLPAPIEIVCNLVVVPYLLYTVWCIIVAIAIVIFRTVQNCERWAVWEAALPTCWNIRRWLSCPASHSSKLFVVILCDCLQVLAFWLMPLIIHYSTHNEVFLLYKSESFINLTG